jgi:uncharacterized protein YciI
MFIVSLTYKTPIEEVEKHIADHVAFLDKYYALNIFIFSGRKNPRTGGIILANNVTRSELEQIITEDPFCIQKIADYDVIEFTPTKFDARFGPFITS